MRSAPGWALLAAPLLVGALARAPLTWIAALDGRLPLAPLLTSGALLYVAVWALAALILPWLVRGRWLAVDVIAASAWAAALGAGTAAAAQAIGAPEPRHLALASIVAGGLAVVLGHLRRVWVVEP